MLPVWLCNIFFDNLIVCHVETVGVFQLGLLDAVDMLAEDLA